MWTASDGKMLKHLCILKHLDKDIQTVAYFYGIQWMASLLTFKYFSLGLLKNKMVGVYWYV